MTADAKDSLMGMAATMITEADALIARGAQLAERVLEQFPEGKRPASVQAYLEDCELYQRKWSDAGMVGQVEGASNENE